MKTWKDLRFIKQIVIRPEDANHPMWVELKDEADYDDNPWYEGNRMLVSRERCIKLGANAMYTIHMDYPEDFKKLVVATGDTEEAFRMYQQLQKKVPDNWADYAEENVW